MGWWNGARQPEKASFAGSYGLGENRDEVAPCSLTGVGLKSAWPLSSRLACQLPYALTKLDSPDAKGRKPRPAIQRLRPLIDLQADFGNTVYRQITFARNAPFLLVAQKILTAN